MTNVIVGCRLYRGDLNLLSVWKSALTLYIWNKHLLNSEHQFAVVIVGEKAQWVGVCVCVFTCI